LNATVEEKLRRQVECTGDLPLSGGKRRETSLVAPSARRDELPLVLPSEKKRGDGVFSPPLVRENVRGTSPFEFVYLPIRNQKAGIPSDVSRHPFSLTSLRGESMMETMSAITGLELGLVTIYGVANFFAKSPGSTT
jgi:hypothetical protein